MSRGVGLVAGCLALWLGPCLGAAPTQVHYARVTPDHSLQFPADYGSHPDYRTEWWYVTGSLRTADGGDLGFQVTFFRTRPDVETANPSAFTARQVLIAHAAISDPAHGRLWRDQRIRRAGLGLAEATSGDTRVWIDDWRLERSDHSYETRVSGEDFGYELKLSMTQPPMLNGAAGVSRKGPEPAAASFYYSVPHLAVTGSIRRAGHSEPVTGEAWLDHEWSSEYLDAAAVGWDWIGINLEDGGALMAFRIRDAQGNARWSGGTLRRGDGKVEAFSDHEVEFTAGRYWTSARTGIRYPVEWQVRTGERSFRLVPLLDDQENDTRLSTGAIYWEGAIRAFDGSRPVGRGYLELTGYGEKLKLR